jgi:predicted MPP superfamily phosphohydrolase
VVLPFIGPPILPYLGKKYPLGLYQVGDMIQYTNRGVGMTLPNVRFNCRPEITIFTLESV